MLPAGSFIVLIYYIAFQWLKMEKKRTQFPYSVEEWLQKWAIASVVGFYCAIGTIDGAGYPDLHSIGAVFFFITLFVTAGAITIVSREMDNWNPTTLTRGSLLTKMVIVGFISGTAGYCAIGAILEGSDSNDDDIYMVIIEWVLCLGGLVWLLTFTLDWKNIFLTFRGDVSQTIKRIPTE